MQLPSKILLNPAICILFAGLLMATAFTACGILDSDKNSSLRIETDKELYDLNEDEYISVNIENSIRNQRRKRIRPRSGSLH